MRKGNTVEKAQEISHLNIACCMTEIVQEAAKGEDSTLRQVPGCQRRILKPARASFLVAKVVF